MDGQGHNYPPISPESFATDGETLAAEREHAKELAYESTEDLPSQVVEEPEPEINFKGTQEWRVELNLGDIEKILTAWFRKEGHVPENATITYKYREYSGVSMGARLDNDEDNPIALHRL